MNATAMQPAPEPLADAEIVRRVAAGESALFEILMRRHNQRIYRAVRAVLRNDEDVEDVMQQAYLNAYLHLAQFAGDAQFSTWLTRIAVNEALARRRRSGLVLVDGDDTMTMEIPDQARTPEEQASSAELRAVMEREVADLPDGFRAVFILREVEGMNTEETATCLGISEDLVKTRLHRARLLLRDRLYARAGVTLDSIFTFGNARCDQVVSAVLARIATS